MMSFQNQIGTASLVKDGWMVLRALFTTIKQLGPTLLQLTLLRDLALSQFISATFAVSNPASLMLNTIYLLPHLISLSAILNELYFLQLSFLLLIGCGPPSTLSSPFQVFLLRASQILQTFVYSIFIFLSSQSLISPNSVFLVQLIVPFFPLCILYQCYGT